MADKINIKDEWQAAIDCVCGSAKWLGAFSVITGISAISFVVGGPTLVGVAGIAFPAFGVIANYRRMKIARRWLLKHHL